MLSRAYTERLFTSLLYSEKSPEEHPIEHIRRFTGVSGKRNRQMLMLLQSALVAPCESFPSESISSHSKLSPRNIDASSVRIGRGAATLGKLVYSPRGSSNGIVYTLGAQIPTKHLRKRYLEPLGWLLP